MKTPIGRLVGFGTSIGAGMLDAAGRRVGRIHESTPLPADVIEGQDAFRVVFDAPGARRSDVQVRFEDDTVFVRIDRFRPFREGFEMRFPGRGLTLSGSASLPSGASVDPSAATAELDDTGSLRVTLPKAAASESGSEA
ncbi:MAG: Hsp20/alpha crystallin family protein [Halodesulfurarchaeum sp.]